MTLNEVIIKIRVDLQNSKIKKSGQNKFAGFSYYELSDFLPKLNELMAREGVNDCVTVIDDKVRLTLIKGDERQNYDMPYYQFNTPKGMQDIQYLGALMTYYKRYLYLNAFGITDGEIIDSMDNSELEVTSAPKPPKAKKAKSSEWRDKVMAGLEKYGVDKKEFAAVNNLNTSSTEEQFKAVYLETIANWELEGGIKGVAN